MYENVNLGKNVSDLEISPAYSAYSKVVMTVSDDTVIEVGTDSGRTLEVSCPWGTEALANRILSSLQGWQYQPLTASNAILDPATELGDGVTANGFYTGVFSVNRRYGTLMLADITAPTDDETVDEYSYESKADRELTRKFVAVESELSLQSDQIAAKVSQKGGNNSSFGWQLLSDHFSLFSNGLEVFKVNSSGAEVKGTIRATDGAIGGFTIGSNSIYNNISDFGNSGGKSSGVYLGTDGIRLGKNFSVSNSGNITANNATLTGTLSIGGKSVDASDLGNGASGYWSGGGAAGTKFTNMSGAVKGYPLWASSFRIGSLGRQYVEKTIYYKNHGGGNTSATVLALATE